MHVKDVKDVKSEVERVAMVEEHERRTRVLVEFMASCGASREYQRNCAQRILWWVERGFEGTP
jgi:hypothetical protein